MTMSNELYGIDVSKWQGDIEWDTLAQNKDLSFVIMRAASGTSMDSRFAEYVAECKRVGIPFGLYFASTAKNVNAAKKEAELAIEVAKKHKPDYPIWYDVELDSQRKLGKKAVTEIVLTWLDAVSAAGIRCGFYSNRDWLNNAFDYAKLKGYPLWYAAYPSMAEKKLTEATKNNRSKLSYPEAVIWQWSSSGKVPGIVAPVDLNVCYEDLLDKGKADSSEIEVAAAKEIIAKKAGLSEATITYLDSYKYGDALLKKLAKAML